jgi:hypothetical protein
MTITDATEQAATDTVAPPPRDTGIREAPAAVPAPSLPRPVAGDHLTLYTLEQASPYLHLHVQTLRRQARDGTIPGRFLTRPGGRPGATGRGTKLCMTGDQILGLLKYWANVPAAASAPAEPVRRRRAAS